MRNFERFGAAALFFFIGAAASAQLNFIGPTDRPQTGSEPTRVASGDVNNDGDPDVVCTNRLSNTVSIFLGDGQGGLTFSQNRTVGTGPLGIVCVDVNADGDRDIVTANRTGNSISVLLGNGNGTFQTATTIAVGSGTNPREIATADMNGDGARDVILVLEGSNSAQIRYNNGAGGFGSANVTLPVPANPSNLRITDIDSDGDRDIFVTLNAGVGGVRLYRNNGSGAFPSSLQSTISWPGATYVQGIGIADFDADGFNDLAVTEGTAPVGALVILFGNGTANFSYSASQRYRTSGNPLTLTVGDIDDDGYSDIVTTCYDDGVANIFWNDWNGDFSYERSCQGLGPQSTNVVLTDLDNDFELDMVACIRGANELRVYGSRTYAVFTYADPWEPNFDGPMPIDIDMGPAHALETYFLGITGSGWTPPINAGNGFVVPIVFDALTSTSLSGTSPYFVGFTGILDAFGYAQAVIVPPSITLPSLAGLKIDLVAVTGVFTATGFQITAVSSAVSNDLL